VKVISGIFLSTILAVVLFGCQQLIRENYDAIRTGMTKKEVMEILGKPQIETRDLFEYQGKNLVRIAVTFENERVVDKWYQDEKTLLGLEKPLDKAPDKPPEAKK